MRRHIGGGEVRGLSLFARPSATFMIMPLLPGSQSAILDRAPPDLLNLVLHEYHSIACPLTCTPPDAADSWYDNAMAKTAADDRAVREYLQFIEDPQQLIDAKQVAELERRMAAATDPLDRLVAIAEYERARHPVEDDYRSAFVEHARSWADTHQVTASAFRQLGVPGDVLEEAGLLESGSPASSSRIAKRSVGVEDLIAAARRMRGTFRSSDVVDAAGGGSPMTVRKALTQLIDAGELKRLGPDPDWSSKGRAPILYERVR